VSLLLDRAEQDGQSWLKGRTIDPSCGGGAFLVEAALRIASAMEAADPLIAVHAIGNRLTGWEIDPFGAWLAQLTVDIATLPLANRAGARIPELVHTRDSLRAFEDGAGKFDLVVGNPPFGKVKDTTDLRSTFGRSLFGHPNLYGMFTDLAVMLAKPRGGRIAYLTPASFLAGNYFKRLRGLLTSTCPPVSLDFVSSRRDVFEDVLQEVVLSTLRRGRQAGLVKCHAVAVADDGLAATKTGEVEIPVGEAPWILPRSSSDAALVAHLSTLRGTLADWGYRVSTGPLVWNRHKPRLHDAPGEGRVPVVWAEAISGGRFDLGGPRRAHKLWFAPRAEDEAVLVRSPCVLVQRTTSAEQERRIVCAPLPTSLIERHGSITVENHLNMVVPTVKAPKIPPAALARFLSSEVVDRVIRCINASVAVSASELEAIPLPDAGDVLTALRSKDPDEALGKLYGS
jgi:adenine-specific DNA-methyltransferase